MTMVGERAQSTDGWAQAGDDMNDENRKMPLIIS
jgi:hypothetical protein